MRFTNLPKVKEFIDNGEVLQTDVSSDLKPWVFFSHPGQTKVSRWS